MNGRPYTALAASLLIIALAGCGSSAPVMVSDNFAYLYGKGAAAMRMDARVYRPDSTHATIYFKLNTADLLYKGTGGGGPYEARVLLRFEVYPTIDSKTLLDSATTLLTDQGMEPSEDKLLVGELKMQHIGGRSGVVRITAHDLVRDSESAVVIPVGSGDGAGRHFYLPLDVDGIPLFTDHIRPHSTITIRSERFAGRDVMVAHFKPITQLPAPVFAQIAPPPLDGVTDHISTIHVPKDGAFNFTADTAGFYHFRADTSGAEGYTLFVSPGNFPEVAAVNDMLPPLRYVTSLQEWDRINKGKDIRKEVERFWTDAAGDRERARAAIAAYYGRVESADRHFTSYVAGWKTDRGLVHIIFGTPNTIRKDDKGETWIYGDESNLMSLSFRFIKRAEPYSDNDLVLQRNAQLKSAWYRNVESWRNGRILQN